MGIKTVFCGNKTVTNMKIRITLLSLLAWASQASASLLIYEGFDYTAGANGLNSQNGGTGFTAAWGAADNADVSAGSMGYTDGGGRALTTSGNRLLVDASGVSPATGVTISPFRSVASALDTVTGNTVYISLLGQKLSGTGRAMNFAFFTDIANNGVYTSQERISVGHGTNQPNAAGPFTWGAFVFGNGNNGALPQVIGSNYSTTSILDSAFVVLKIEANASGLDERFSLFINPSLDAEGVPVATFLRDSLVSINEIDRIRPFAGGSNATLAPSPADFDELRIGTSWADVTPFTLVPEPGAVTMGLLALMGLLVRRRR